MTTTNRFSLRSWMPYLGLGVAVLVTAMALWHFWADGAVPDAIPRPVSPRGELDPDEKSTIALFRQASPGVVNITTITMARDFFTLNLLEIP